MTLLGEEVIPVYNNVNFNESRGFLFTWGEPLTHTGVRAQYSFNDKVGLTMGLNNGWDDPSDNNDGKSVEGQLSVTPTDWLSVLVNGIYGRRTGQPRQFQARRDRPDRHHQAADD